MNKEQHAELHDLRAQYHNTKIEMYEKLGNLGMEDPSTIRREVAQEIIKLQNLEIETEVLNKKFDYIR